MISPFLASKMALHWISVLGDLGAGVGVGVAEVESIVGADAGFDAWGCAAVDCAGVLGLAWVLGVWRGAWGLEDSAGVESAA